MGIAWFTSTRECDEKCVRLWYCEQVKDLRSGCSREESRIGWLVENWKTPRRKSREGKIKRRKNQEEEKSRGEKIGGAAERVKKDWVISGKLTKHTGGNQKNSSNQLLVLITQETRRFEETFETHTVEKSRTNAKLENWVISGKLE